MTVWPLSFYTLGLCGYFGQQVLTRALYSIQESKVPAVSAVIAVFVNVILNLTLVWFLQAGGLAAATAICSYLQVAILLSALYKRLGSSILDGLATALLKTVAATLFMSAAVLIILWLLQSWADSYKLLFCVPSAIVMYILAAKFLHIDELSLLTGRKDKDKQSVER
jgi:putative peptidoglycan lipid II flippase